MTESYWYSNHDKTLDRFKTNQFSFIAQGQRFVHRDDAWHVTPQAHDACEPALTVYQGGAPLEEAQLHPAAQSTVRQAFAGFRHYASTVAAPTKRA